MRFHFDLFCVLTTFCLVVAFASATIADSNQESISDREPVNSPRPPSINSLEQLLLQEESVPAAYAKLERLIAASGKDAELTTDGFVLWTEDQFSALRWSTLTDTLGEPGLSTGSKHKTHADGQRSLSFSASWIPHHDDRPPRRERCGDRSVADVLKVSAEFAPWDPLIQNLDVAIRQRPELLTDQVVLDPRGFFSILDAALGSGWTEPSEAQKKRYQDPKHPFPVLIQLTQDRLALTGLDDSVVFDLNADGFAETVGGSACDGNAAFLAMDRNHDISLTSSPFRDEMLTATNSDMAPRPSSTA